MQMNMYYATDHFYRESIFGLDASFVLKENAFSLIQQTKGLGTPNDTLPTLSFRKEETHDDFLGQATSQAQQSTQDLSQGATQEHVDHPCLTWEQQKHLFDSPYLARAAFLKSPYFNQEDF